MDPHVSGSTGTARSGSIVNRKTVLLTIVLLLTTTLIMILPVFPRAGAAHPITFTKTGPATASYGDTITYTFKVEHAAWGPAPYTGVKVTDPLFGAGWSHDLGTINPGDTKTFTKDYQVKDTDPDPLVNEAKAEGMYDGAVSPYYATCSVDITGPAPKPAIKVSKTGPLDALVYETITYTIAVLNTGDVTLNDVRVSDSLVSSFEWDVGTLAPGEGDYRHVKYTVTPDSPYPLKNMAFGMGTPPKGETVTDNSTWTTKAPGLFGYQFMPNATTRTGYQTFTGVFNASGQTAGSSISYGSQDGTSYTQGSEIPPYSRSTFNAANTPDMPAGDYTATLQSDQTTLGAQSTFGSFNNEVPGGYGYVEGASGKTVYLPNICTRYGYQSTIAVQNTGTGPANVTVHYNGDGSVSWASYDQSASVPEGARHSFNPATIPGMAQGDYSAVIESDQPVAVAQSTYCMYDGKHPVAYGSSGIIYGGTRIYLPNVCTQNGYHGYTAVQNVGTGEANVNIIYKTDGSVSWARYDQSATVPQGSRHTFVDNYTPDMPPGDYSAVIESDQPVVVSNSTFGDFKGHGYTAYATNGVKSPAQVSFLPNISTRGGSYTYIGVQNAGDDPATVSVELYGQNGPAATHTVVVNPQSRGTIAVNDIEGLAPGDYSAKVDSDRPVTVSQSSFIYSESYSGSGRYYGYGLESQFGPSSD